LAIASAGFLELEPGSPRGVRVHVGFAIKKVPEAEAAQHARKFTET
jgi:hydrogenase maturation factor